MATAFRSSVALDHQSFSDTDGPARRPPGANRLRQTTAIASLALLVLGGCGGGDSAPRLGGANDSSLAACQTAFDAAGTSNAGASLTMLSSDATVTDAVPLSQCVGADRNVTIGGAGGCGPNVVIDRSFTGAEALGKITIAAGGKLVVPRVFDTLELHTKGISVAGVLSLGTAKCPIGLENPSSKMKVVFTGNRADVPAIPGQPNGSGTDKGIQIEAGGALRLFGAKGVVAADSDAVSWTHLSQPAGPAAYQRADQKIGAPVPVGGERMLRLARNVTLGAGAWGVGDWIVVATSSFSPFESEFVQIASISANGSGGTDLTLTQALRHYHFGGADPGVPSAANFGAGKEINFGVDERSEVGLISRNITFTAQTPDVASGPNNPELHWGGEIRILPNFAEAFIQGVELEKFGKERLGSYPIHLHMVGDVPKGKTLFNSNSIHHSYNKCIAVHMSSNLTFENNVCARAVGHLFYQEIGFENNISFLGNLGLGAMSNSFGIDLASSLTPKINGQAKNWWEGDNLAAANGYDGLNIRNMDDQTNPTHGSCYSGVLDGLGRPYLIGAAPPPCNDTNPIYVEPASGFWITNPSTVLKGNSIGGCQGVGKGYWYVPPAKPDVRYPDIQFLKNREVGAFENNRVHACYDGLFNEGELAISSTEQLFPKKDNNPDAHNVIAHFKGLTATRIRNRGTWMRPTWNTIEHGRFATNRDSAVLVSSGGPDGNAPGVWALLQDSVFLGVSTNNVDRWGPCPTISDGENYGCVDYNPASYDLFGKRYQTPAWNSAGYMIYDGPVRIFNNHFVNFLRDPTDLLTIADAKAMKDFVAYPNGNSPAKSYEGDAALGWFQTNQSAYPTATAVRKLTFENVDLRHQIYTEHVNQSGFDDGDKNTVIVDLDGSLTGYKVIGPNGEEVPGHYPVSLNNLEFNHASNAANECWSTGTQDAVLEGRPTSIISPAHMATLEFDTLNGPKEAGQTWWQDMIFTKNWKTDGETNYSAMRLKSRNGQGVWEPKVASGFGYIVESAPGTKDGTIKVPDGMDNIVNVGLTDAVKPHMDKDPFYVRLGIRYVDQNGNPPSPAAIKIKRGFKSWGGNGVNYNDPVLKQTFNFLDGVTTYKGGKCTNINGGNLGNLQGCPAASSIPMPASGCPAGSAIDPDGQPFCLFPTKNLTAVASLDALTDPITGKPTGDNYFYESASGILFFYVQQDFENARAPAPLGSCLNGSDPACTDEHELDTYYPCPAQGCVNYQVELDNSYKSGKNTKPLSTADIHANYILVPKNQNQLAYVNGNAVVKPTGSLSSAGFYHWTPDKEESVLCPTTTAKPVKPVASAKTTTVTRTALAGAKYWLRSAMSTAELSTPPTWLKFTSHTPTRQLVADAGNFATGLGPICSAAQFR